MTHRIGYETNVVTMRIPRGCIGDPRWVKASLDNGFSAPPVDAPWCVDNPHNIRAHFFSFTPRLYRAPQ